MCIIPQPGIILCMRPANKRHYIVTSSLIGWVHTHNDPCTTHTKHHKSKWHIVWSRDAQVYHAPRDLWYIVVQYCPPEDLRDYSP